MPGFAQTLFHQTHGRSLTKEVKKERWPALELAVSAGSLSYIDLAFADFILRDYPTVDATTAAFFCHLSKCSREGHLCVKKVNGDILPSPEKVWSLESGEPLPSEVSSLLARLVTEDPALPEDLIASVDAATPFVPLKPICRKDHCYYLQKYWVFESRFVENLLELLNRKPKLEIDAGSVKSRVKKMTADLQLNEQQAEAILNSVQGCFSIICGGPGTGKTYTAGHLIKIILESLSDVQRSSCEIVLAAPTGKAANALQISLEKAFNNLPDTIKSKTLHSLLEIRSSRKFTNSPQKKLSADIILIDESSMIDIGLISTLFASIKPGARLIMLGDPCQLPPVESGSAFKDMIAALDSRFPGKYIFPLKTCLRAELKEIVEFSEKVNQSDVEGVMIRCGKGPISRLDLAIDEEPKKAREKLLNYSISAFPKPHYRGQDPEELIAAFNEFRLLSPLKKGKLGIEELNTLFYQKMKGEVAWNEYFAAPIMVVTNDYKRELFNGEVGVLISKKSRLSFFEPGDAAYFSGGKEGGCRKIPANLLPRFEYAYCLSVHKSQGSEFNRVLLLLPKGSEKFGREVFYTAVTRTKQKLEICGSDDTIRKTLLNTSDRLSGIS